MTGADISRLPATKIPEAGVKSVKNSNSNDNSKFENIMMSMGQSSYRKLEVDSTNNSLKLVSSKKTSVQINVKVDLTKNSVLNSQDVKGSSMESVENTPNDSVEAKNGQETKTSSKSDTKDVHTEDNKTESKVELDQETEEEIKKVISKNLGISEDDIVNAMQTLGLNFVDLLDPKNMMMVVSEALDVSDPISLLNVDGMKELISDLKDLANNLDLSELGLTAVPEEEVDFNQVIQNITGMDENVVDETRNPLNDKIVSEENPETNADTKVIVEDFRTKAEEKSTSFREEAENESQTGVSNDLVSKVLNKNEKNMQNDNSSNLFSQNQNNQNIKVNPENNQVVNTFELNANATEIEVTTASLGTVKVDVSSMIDKMVQNAKVTLTDSVHTMEMVLNPEELGKIFMEITSKDGAVKAKILAQNETVKAALETQLAILQDRFKDQGMKVDSVEISVGTHEFKENQEKSEAMDMNMNGENHHKEESNENSEKGNRLHRIDLNNLDDLQGLMTDEEVLTAKIMKAQGNTLNYQA